MRLAGLILRGRRLVAGEVGVAGGRVLAVPEGGARRLPEGWIVAPGFVDLQVNGYAGAEVGDDPEALAAIARALPRAGVTAFCPTLVSLPPDGYRHAAAAIAGAPPGPPAAARRLGVHLEGPFLARPGAHDPAELRDPEPAELERLLTAFAPAIVTLAPERRGAIAAIGRIARSGTVVAVGHTDADAALARRAIAAGASLLTHALNAMRGVEARAPSALLAFLLDRRARVSLIGDGVHVAPEAAALVARAAGRRLVLVSDAVAAAGAPTGRHLLGGRPVESDGRRVTAGGRLAGSTAGLDAGPRTLVAAGLARAAALAAACEAPRRLLGQPPGLEPGGPADLVVLDEGLAPRLTLVGGRVAYADPALPFDVP